MGSFLLNLLILLGIMIVGSLVVVVGFTIISVFAFLIRSLIVAIITLFKKGGNDNDRV